MLFVRPVLYTFVVLYFIWQAAKSRDSKVLFHVIMVFCWVIIALSMDSHDISNYRGAYDYGFFRRKELLFDLFQFIFSGLNIPFAVFKLLYGTVIWLLLYRALKNYTLDVALAAAIFVLGPMIGFGTQMRSSMAGAIVLNAVPLLLKKDEKVWKYCVLVALASQFHLMAAFYFVFLIPKYLRISAEKFRNYACLLAIALIPFFLVFSWPISKLFAFMQTLTNISAINRALGRFVQYFSGEMSPNIKGFLFAACAHLVVFITTDRMCVVMQNLRDNMKDQENRDLLLSGYAVSYLRKLNSIMVLIVPCYILSMQFDRFNSYFVPICYCLIAQGGRELRLTGKAAQVLTLKEKVGKQNLFPKLLGSKLFQIGNFELAVLLACLIFCYFVSNRFSATSEFVRIVNGIGLFGGPQ